MHTISLLTLSTAYCAFIFSPDPYCLVSFHTSSAKTIVISETVCPTWDQTILMNNIRIFGDTSKVVESPPPVVIEFVDKDTVVSGLNKPWAVQILIISCIFIHLLYIYICSALFVKQAMVLNFI